VVSEGNMVDGRNATQDRGIYMLKEQLRKEKRIISS
jgi:hypothetical protein